MYWLIFGLNLFLVSATLAVFKLSF